MATSLVLCGIRHTLKRDVHIAIIFKGGFDRNHYNTMVHVFHTLTIYNISQISSVLLIEISLIHEFDMFYLS